MKSAFGRHTAPVILALLAGLALRIVFVFETPFNEPEKIGKLSAYNDEAAHVEFTRHLLDTGTLPRHASPITSHSYGELPTFENYQSPLYYFVHAAVCHALSIRGAQGIMLTGRLIALALMLLIIATTIAILDKLRRDISEGQRACALIFLLLSGVFVRFSTLSGNEIAAWTASGWIVLAFLRHQEHASSRIFYALILAFSIGVYVKLSLILLVPLIALAMRQTMAESRNRALIGGLFLVVAVIPLFVYNTVTFGSPIPLAVGFGDPLWRIPTLDSALYAIRSAIFPWSELWQNWVGAMLLFPAGILILFLGIGVFSARLNHTWAATILATALLAYVALNLRYDQAEARYVLIAWPALLVGVTSLPKGIMLPWLWMVALLTPYLLFVI